MANKYRGEIAFKVGEKSYTFRLGTNELVKLEKELGVEDPFEKLSKGQLGVSALRTIMHVALSRHHEGLSEEQAGDLIDELGFAKLGDLVSKAMEPLAAEAESPKEAAAGTGPVSLPPASAQG